MKMTGYMGLLVLVLLANGTLRCDEHEDLVLQRADLDAQWWSANNSHNAWQRDQIGNQIRSFHNDHPEADKDWKNNFSQQAGAGRGWSADKSRDDKITSLRQKVTRDKKHGATGSGTPPAGRSHAVGRTRHTATNH